MHFSSLLLVLSLFLLNFFPARACAEELDRYHAILGLAPDASFAEAQEAYRRLASDHLDRRDTVDSDPGHAKFQDVKEAFEKIREAYESGFSLPSDRRAAEAIRMLAKATSTEKRIQALQAMAEFAENIAINQTLRTQADEAVRDWIGDGSHLQISELKAYYGFLGRVDFLIYNLVDSNTYYEIPFLYDGIILDSLGRRPDFKLEDLIRLIKESGGMAKDSYGLSYGASFKFKWYAAEALFRFGLQKNLLHSYDDVEKYSLQIRPIFKDGNQSLFGDMDRFAAHYFQNVLSWVPRLRAENFERLRFVLPYHQSLILLEEALRQHIFKEPWEILYAVEHVQGSQDSTVGDVKARGLALFRNLSKPSSDPIILEKNHERRLRIFKAAAITLKELRASSTEFGKLASLLMVGFVDRGLFKISNPFVRFQWPERDYASIHQWPQRPVSSNVSSLNPSRLFSHPKTCAKVYEN